MIQLNPSERVDFYRVLPNDNLVKLSTSINLDFINNLINNDNILNLISQDLLKQTEAVIGFIKNEKTLELSKICYYKIIELEMENTDEQSKDQSNSNIEK